jgi:UDP-GlcNAc:undecaprenyl-phosphate GlcNAc-1-phosphate transferase
MKYISIRVGLTDHPSDRKHHDGQVPLCGGIAIFIASVSVWLCSASLMTPAKISFFIAGFLLLVLGLLDDLWDISSRWRLIFQTCAALLLVFVGHISLGYFGDLLGTGHGLNLNGAWATFATVFCVVGVINAVNMIDGLDGLAGGLTLIALIWFGLIAADIGEHSIVSIILLFTGAIAGFLVFNMRYPGHGKASVFMGDAGSTLLGLLLAFLAIRLTQPSGNSETHLSPINAVWVLGLPMLDTLSLMLLRILRGHSPFAADRDHLHHIILRAGFSVEQTVWILLLFSFTFGAIGYYSWRQAVPEHTLFISAWVVFALYTFAQIYAWRVMLWFKRHSGKR